MKIQVSKLRHHPLNEKIYNLSNIDELKDSIKKVGLLQPLTIDQNNQVISGNRRFASIRELGWKEVEVVRMNIKKGDEPLLLIHFNSQRKKQVSELLSEYDYLKEYYKKNKLKEKGNTIRNKVSEDIKITDGQLARLLYIRKYRSEFIELIDKGILTIGQAYLQSSRNIKEDNSINSNGRDFKSTFQFNKSNFRFYKKSSINMVEVENESINTIFTSPPYANSIRKYSSNDKLGNESDINEYIENLSTHLTDCYRVLSKKGSFFLNMGDVYIDGHLKMVPHQLVTKLLEKNKWILRSTIIWKKTNYKPSSVKNSVTPSYEFVFHLVKNKDYSYERLLLPLSDNTKPSHAPRHRNSNGNSTITSPYIPNLDGKNLPDFWDENTIISAVSNQKLSNGIEHPAMFPISLPIVPIIQTSVLPYLNSKRPGNIKSIVLDPFSGSQSTYKSIEVINKMYGTNIRYIGYDIKKYF